MGSVIELNKEREKRTSRINIVHVIPIDKELAPTGYDFKDIRWWGVMGYYVEDMEDNSTLHAHMYGFMDKRLDALIMQRHLAERLIQDPAERQDSIDNPYIDDELLETLVLAKIGGAFDGDED
tara:strand:+ start:553 stop:921 length:369 start_codon:yes stop_codon:yes gene_type:complete